MTGVGATPHFLYHLEANHCCIRVQLRIASREEKAPRLLRHYLSLQLPSQAKVCLLRLVARQQNSHPLLAHARLPSIQSSYYRADLHVWTAQKRSYLTTCLRVRTGCVVQSTKYLRESPIAPHGDCVSPFLRPPFLTVSIKFQARRRNTCPDIYF